MTKKAFDKIAAGLQDAVDLATGKADKNRFKFHIPSDLDVRAIRKKLNLTQEEFAQRFGFTPARVRDWEQGRSKPDGALRAYLLVIDRDHVAVEKALVKAA